MRCQAMLTFIDQSLVRFRVHEEGEPRVGVLLQSSFGSVRGVTEADELTTGQYVKIHKPVSKEIVKCPDHDLHLKYSLDIRCGCCLHLKDKSWQQPTGPLPHHCLRVLARARGLPTGKEIPAK